MGAQGHTHLSLAKARDQPADNGAHRHGRNPFGCREPHGSDRRRGLAPTQTRLYGGMVLLIGFEHLGVRPPRSPSRDGQPGPPLVALSSGQGVHRYPEAIARLGRRRAATRLERRV